jgi:hypothetical protein
VFAVAFPDAWLGQPSDLLRAAPRAPYLVIRPTKANHKRLALHEIGELNDGFLKSLRRVAHSLSMPSFAGLSSLVVAQIKNRYCSPRSMASRGSPMPARRRCKWRFTTIAQLATSLKTAASRSTHLSIPSAAQKAANALPARCSLWSHFGALVSLQIWLRFAIWHFENAALGCC